MGVNGLDLWEIPIIQDGLKNMFGNRKNYYKYLQWRDYYQMKRDFMQMGIYFTP